jgi:arylsulfatase A-like enzyme
LTGTRGVANVPVSVRSIFRAFSTAESGPIAGSLNAATLALALALAALSGCRRQAFGLDLVGELPFGEKIAEPGVIDLGTPAARRFLREGWSSDEVSPASHETFVWSLGPRSVLDFTLPQARDLVVELRGEPFDAGKGRRQEVTATLNGAAPQTFAIAAGSHEYPLAFPAGATRVGANRLELRYAWTARPHDVTGSADGRELAVAWDRVHVVGLTREAAAGPRAVQEGRALFMPWGTSVRYYLHLPCDSRLSIRRLAATGKGTLEVEEERDGQPATAIAKVRIGGADGPGRGVEAALPLCSVVRLSLKAAAGPGEPGGLTLVAPTILQPPPSPLPTRVPAPRGTPARPSIVVYLVDTLRSDHLGCYGYGRPVSPHIDAFASDAVIFEDAVSETSWTRPAVASLFTGLSARAHGVNGRMDALPGQALTMAEILAGLGYQTVGFTVNGNVAREFGFDQGFSRYELLPGSILPSQAGALSAAPRGGDAPRSSELNERLEAWFAGRTSRSPLFLYLHTADLHSPYRPVPRWRQRFASGVVNPEVGGLPSLKRLAQRPAAVREGPVRELIDLYDAEVAEADEGFGRSLDELRRRGLYDSAAILFVSDHGEEFHDHGYWEHGHTLYSEVVHIPLILKLPAGRGRAGLRVRGLVQLADVLPTLLDLLGEPPPPLTSGRSVLTRLVAPSAPSSGTAHSYLNVDTFHAESVQAEGFKLIDYPAGDDRPAELYDVVHDPLEKVDCVSDHSVMEGYLTSRLVRLQRMTTRVLGAQRGEVDADVLDNLRALGYVR